MKMSYFNLALNYIMKFVNRKNYNKNIIIIQLRMANNRCQAICKKFLKVQIKVKILKKNLKKYNLIFHIQI